jgi:hypothetical protein
VASFRPIWIIYGQAVLTKPGSKSESSTTVRALIGIDPCPMAAIVIRATDQQASGAHLCESDLLLAGVEKSAAFATSEAAKAGDNVVGDAGGLARRRILLP